MCIFVAKSNDCAMEIYGVWSFLFLYEYDSTMRGLVCVPRFRGAYSMAHRYYSAVKHHRDAVAYPFAEIGLFKTWTC